MSMTLFSSSPTKLTTFPLSSPSSKNHFHFLSLRSNSNTNFFQLSSSRTTDNGSGRVVLATASVEGKISEAKFDDPKWVSGTWNLTKFQKEGKTDWDAVIDAEVRRRKWLEDNPESTNNNDPVVFDSSIIPWWSWVKRFHLPEAELLNGRAAMIGFFMTYLVDSLTGAGLVDQMGNLFCKTLLFGTVAGVLLIRKNEDVENIKKLVEETTFYDRQWQATWKDETSSIISNKV